MAEIKKTKSVQTIIDIFYENSLSDLHNEWEKIIKNSFDC